MKKTLLTTLLLLIALCAFAVAESDISTGGFSYGGECVYFEVKTPIPTVVSVKIDGRLYLMDVSETTVASTRSTCGIHDYQLGNRAPELDQWVGYSNTQHQYRIYYHATCTNCKRNDFVFVPGEMGLHIWKYGSDYHAMDDQHAIEEVCSVCNHGIVSYVFCPGADGGGCTVP